MRKMMMLILMLVFTVSIAFADNFIEIDTSVGCNDYRTVVGNLMMDYGEKMIFEGQISNNVYTGLFTNSRTGTWSVIKYDDDKIVACLIADGVGYDIP